MENELVELERQVRLASGEAVRDAFLVVLEGVRAKEDLAGVFARAAFLLGSQRVVVCRGGER